MAMRRLSRIAMFRRRECVMSGLEWFLGFALLAMYVACLFTVCIMTFQKGRTLLGIIGIFIPLLWLIGAFLPAKEGSRYKLEQDIAFQRQVQEYTN
jgi:hypothetical protein